MNNDARVGLPMDVKCKACDGDIPRLTPLRGRKEAVAMQGPFLIFRYSMSCPLCSAEFTFRTDPVTGDYIMESAPCQVSDVSDYEFEEEEEEEEDSENEKEKESEMVPSSEDIKSTQA